MTVTTQLPVGFDPTDPGLIEERIPHEEFRALRQSSPVHWVEQPQEARAGFKGVEGYWALTRHEDIAAVSKNSKSFSTAKQGAIIRFAPDMTPEQVELQGVMLINQDPPDHTKLRQVISRGFTPRAINALHDALAERAKKIVADAKAKGSGNFVEDIAAELPLQAIAELMGVPQEDRGKLFDWSNQMLSYDDPEIEGDAEAASIEILTYAAALADERRQNPKDDIVTKLITADVNGHALTDDEFGFFVILLAVAGNETTRNAITHGMGAFFDNPDQWELYKKERPQSAVDEVVRWATPVTVFQRVALEDVEINGTLVKEGDRVGLFYASGNFDEDVFDDPYSFNIMREENPHLGFGGHGAHYCIGANLARLEIELIFNEVADQIPDIKRAGDARRLRSAWINGVKELQVTY
ncbi:cytochrome P450 [Nocardioides sp. AE5]|uniref:cytochrome P450 n=1 Tax=Nocardioides sp. AE5 TaxID=2962573 RepID=UPI00288116AC|nr:cytochrome P450 [Nocardioides sp. AE5]MDT0201628.1 cytochrome P450 [Nocardioides sp. AE5]